MIDRLQRKMDILRGTSSPFHDILVLNNAIGLIDRIMKLPKEDSVMQAAIMCAIINVNRPFEFLWSLDMFLQLRITTDTTKAWDEKMSVVHDALMAHRQVIDQLVDAHNGASDGSTIGTGKGVN